MIRSHDPEAAAAAAILLFEGLPVDMEGAEPSVMQLVKVSFAAFVCACVRACVRVYVCAVVVVVVVLFCLFLLLVWISSGKSKVSEKVSK